MTMKKRRVPAALHFELTEYASLLRALRTRDAMDLTAHLTKPSPFTLPPQSDENLDSDNDNLDDELPDDLSSRSASAHVNSRENSAIAGPSDLYHPINKAIIAEEPVKASKKKVAPKRKRDQWTRWPLLLEDVPIPEWTLEDEVAVIASRVMKSRPKPTFPVFEGPLEFDDPSHTDYVMNTEFDEDDPDYPLYVPYLTSITASLLSTIFSLLAKHTPARPASMQNRIEPLNWRSVIDVLVNCDDFEYANPKIVENVIKRMEAIYGPSFSPLDGKMATSFRTVDRIKNKKAETDRIHKLLEEPMTSFFSQASPPPNTGPLSTPPPSPVIKRKRDQTLSPGERNYKIRKHWVPKSKKNQDQEHDTEYNNGSQPQEPVRRRSTRVRSKVSYNTDDAME